MDELRRMWDRGCSRQEIAAAFGFSTAQLFDRGREARGKGRLPHPGLRDLPVRQGQGGGYAMYKAMPPPPTPKEIQQRCETIQSQWSPAEREARRRGYMAEAPDRRPSERYGWQPTPPRGVVFTPGRLDTGPRDKW
jgi:hypothetical protein